MSTYKVTDPKTGLSVKLTGDSPPTEQELENIFSRLQPPQEEPGMIDKASSWLKNKVSPPREDLPELSSIYQGDPESALKLYQRKDPSATLSQDQYGNPVFNTKEGRAYPDRPGFTMRDIPQAISDGTESLQAIAPAVAAGGITAGSGLATATGAAAATGLTSGFTRKLAETGDVNQAVRQGATEAAYDTLGETGGRLLARVLTPLAKTIWGGKKVKIIGDDGFLTDDGIKLLERAQSEGTSLNQYEKELAKMVDDGLLTPKQAERFNKFVAQGIDPTRAQVTRNASDFMDQSEAAKNSGAVRDRLESQDMQIKDKLEGIQPTNPRRVDPYDFAVRRVNEADDVVSDLYRQVREMTFGEPDIKLDGMIDTVRKSLPEDGITGGMVRAIRGQLKEMGVDIKGGASRISAAQAEEVRKYLNSLSRSTTDRGRMLIKDFKNALDEDVARYAGEDVFAPARQAKAELEGSLNRARTGRRDKRRGEGLLRDVVENKVSPERFTDKLKAAGTRADDISEYRAFLQEQGDEGLAAWETMRRDVLDDIVDRTFKGPQNSRGIGSPTRASFEQALKPWDGKLQEIFQPEEMELMDSLMTLMRYREPVNSYGVGKGPSSQAIMEGAANIVATAKGIGPGAINLIKGFFRGGKEEQQVARALTSLAEEMNAKNEAAVRRALFNYFRPLGQPAGSLAAQESN